MFRRQLLSAIVVFVSIDGCAQTYAKEGANWLDNGDFEWLEDCDHWEAGKDSAPFTKPPVILELVGDPDCLYVHMEAGNAAEATLGIIKQQVDVVANEGQWIILQFDAENLGTGGGRAAFAVEFATDTAVPWTGLRISRTGREQLTFGREVLSGEENPTVTVWFRICYGGGNTHTLALDNVALTVGAEPTPSSFTIASCVDPASEPADLERDTGVTPCCTPNCGVKPSETRPDDIVGFDDVLGVLDQWLDGRCNRCNINNDDQVDFDDLLVVLSNWGKCPGVPGLPPDSFEDELECRDIDYETCWLGQGKLEEMLEYGSVQQQADAICWIQHYDSCHCPDTCVSGPTGCGPDPCGIH